MKKFIFNNKLDISSQDFSFTVDKKNLRDLLRDYFDKCIRRPFYNIKYKNFFKKQNYDIDLVLPSKGFSSNERREKLNSILSVKNKDILCIGCGNGTDILNWLRYKPKSITGVDLLNYSKSWTKVKKFIFSNKIKTKVKFIHNDILKLKEKNKYDFIISDAVFEHLTNFEEVIKFLNSILKKEGIIYASYGPIWPCFGGDHFSSRGKDINGFNHLLLSKKKFRSFFEKNVDNLENEIKCHGSAGIFVKEELFSKLTGNQYMKVFRKNKLETKFLIVEFCPKGYNLLKTNLSIKKKLKSLKSFNLEDFYLKSHIVYLSKKN